jgi:multidrug efflux system membrane fusion protein
MRDRWKGGRTMALALAATLAASLAADRPARADGPAAVTLASAPVRAAGGERTIAFDGTVEAVRQTVVAAQVPGAVVAIEVKAGDTVRAGQLLARIDARAAEQTAAASDAQVAATRANLEVARKELERQRQLFQKEYISRAALDRAEAQYAATRAQVDALSAQAGAARTQSGLHLVRAPYAGVVADVPVALGDMAMPGRALLTLYDPAALRVTVAVPQGLAARGIGAASASVELPSGTAGSDRVAPARATVLPTVDPATHTVQVRLELPAQAAASTRPGAFARAWLVVPSEAGPGARPRLFVPAPAVVRRAELTGVYVIDAGGRPVLRQVRLGPAAGGEIEVLAGVAAGDRVATDPQAAARIR